MSKTAHILAVRSTHLSDELKVSGFHPMTGSDALGALDRAGTFIGPRPLLELDERFRQIIPYVVMKQGPDCIVYRRGAAGGEGRLHGKLSIGVGGHIDLPDIAAHPTGCIDLGVTLDRAATRELDEEVFHSEFGRPLGIPEPRWVGLLVDNGDPVGRVHIGIVGVVDMEGEVHAKEDALDALDSMSAGELQQNANRLESWSALLLPHLQQLGIK